MNEAFSLIGEVGFPIAIALIAGFFIFLTIKYIPKDVCLELKSLKYYLLSFRDVGIVQEHAANRILEDLVRISNPESMTVILDYNSRGGIHTDVSATYDGS